MRRIRRAGIGVGRRLEDLFALAVAPLSFIASLREPKKDRRNGL